MKFRILVICFCITVIGCDTSNVYHEFIDLDNRVWMLADKPQFTFEIRDTTQTYNVYWDIRNSTHYKWSRLFVKFSLKDTLGNDIESKLVTAHLFEPKTGKPYGKSGLGDLFDHRVEVLQNYRFSRAGVYQAELEQYMREDSVPGILSVGVAIEKAVN